MQVFCYELRLACGGALPVRASPLQETRQHDQVLGIRGFVALVGGNVVFSQAAPGSLGTVPGQATPANGSVYASASVAGTGEPSSSMRSAAAPPAAEREEGGDGAADGVRSAVI